MDPHRMVKVIGPTYKDKQGDVKIQYRERDMPYSQAILPEVRQLGITIVDEIAEGLAPDPRKSAAQAEADKLRAQLLEAQAKLAELEKAAEKKTKVKADAGN